MARTIIGEGTSCPSTATPPAGREVTELEATTRTSPTWITSAPALRSSWITQHRRRPHRSCGVGDRDAHPSPLSRRGPGEDLKIGQALLRSVLRRDVILVPGLQGLQGPVQFRVLRLEVGHVPTRFIQQPHQLLLRGALEGVLVVLAHLHHDRQPQQQAQQPHDQLGERGPRSQRGDQPGPVAALLLGGVGGAGALLHDRSSLRRIAAALEKMRMPSTTITAVDSCAPTPSWSPRNTRKEASSTLNRNEVMNTWESKAPSRVARRPPARVSRAATTAIGR